MPSLVNPCSKFEIDVTGHSRIGKAKNIPLDILEYAVFAKNELPQAGIDALVPRSPRKQRLEVLPQFTHVELRLTTSGSIFLGVRLDFRVVMVG
jgi:hypothetical protein